MLFSVSRCKKRGADLETGSLYFAHELVRSCESAKMSARAGRSVSVASAQGASSSLSRGRKGDIEKLRRKTKRATSKEAALFLLMVRYLRAVCSEVGAGRNPRPL
nr:MAG TPA: hypothetical protein [Caudoviricetes sp.]